MHENGIPDQGTSAWKQRDDRNRQVQVNGLRRLRKIRVEEEEQAKIREELQEKRRTVPEELEKHLILNSNRLRTFEDARLELVTYVEAKLGLRSRDSKPCDTGSRGHSDPMVVDAVNSLSSGEGKRVIESV